MSHPRVTPLDPPYAADTQRLFSLVMPDGMEPLKLFRTMATHGRIFSRFMRAGVLDRGPVEIRDRELVILRTTARCGSEYEWGVHVNAFARPLGFSEEMIRGTVTSNPGDPLWSPSQAALLQLCDELHETSSISEALWEELCKYFTNDQLVELIYAVGLYHTVSYLTNGLRIEREVFGERFPGAA